MNTLQEAYDATKAQFPGWWVAIQEELYGEHDNPTPKFRISIVGIGSSQCYGENGSTLDEALKNLVASYNKPKDAEIEKARSFLAGHGYQVSKDTQPSL